MIVQNVFDFHLHVLLQCNGWNVCVMIALQLVFPYLVLFSVYLTLYCVIGGCYGVEVKL